MINTMKYILTFVDFILSMRVMSKKIGKYALEHKNICIGAKTVVILHPQSGTKPRRRNRKRERTLTTMPQDNDLTHRWSGPYRQRQGDTENVSVNLESTGNKPIDDSYPVRNTRHPVPNGTTSIGN